MFNLKKLNFNIHLFFLGILILSSPLIHASLTNREQQLIEEKLSVLPITGSTLINFLRTNGNTPFFTPQFQDEIERILKTTLIEGDTNITLLTYELRMKLGVDRWVVAFHKQGPMSFDIIPSRAGNFKGLKQNETIRTLDNPQYFNHLHNVFVSDAKVSLDMNTLSLLIHELSHAAFDCWISNTPDKLEKIISKYIPKNQSTKLYHLGSNGRIEIDGDLYDLISERYAFELEYRLNREITKNISNWPFAFSFTEVPTNDYPFLIEDYIRRHYDIDHPLLNNLQIEKLDNLLF